MRTEHLDNKINELETLRSRGELTYMGSEMLSEFNEIKRALTIADVSQQRELLDLLTEIANSDTLYSNTRHRMIARKLLKSNCG